MRSVPVAILLSTAFLLAGCSGGDGEELHYVCADGKEIHADDHPEANATKAEDLAKFCAKPTTSGSRSNSTSSAPNVSPILVLSITDPGGNVTPVTLLDGNLTFDATGSSDPDGTIAGIAVTVTDSNTTRTATLYDAAKKEFKSATFNFDRPGPVNVTVAMVDDRAGFTVNQTKVYVNHMQRIGGENIQVPGGADFPAENDACTGSSEDLLDASYFKSPSFILVAGATKVDVTAVDSNLVMTICDPSGTPVSEEYQQGSVSTLPDAVLPPPAGTESYTVGAYAAAAPQQGTSTAMDVLVHYEPQEAAAA